LFFPGYPEGENVVGYPNAENNLDCFNLLIKKLVSNKKCLFLKNNKHGCLLSPDDLVTWNKTLTSSLLSLT
jgi:hypothetical protein